MNNVITNQVLNGIQNNPWVGEIFKSKTKSPIAQVRILARRRVDAYLKELRLFCLNDMVDLNVAYTNNPSSVVLDNFKDSICNFVSKCPRKLNQNQARKVIQYLGFMISSLERHLQGSENIAGYGVRLVKATNLLLRLAKTAKHPPRDSLYTYCLWNTGKQMITFSGSNEERLFIDVVIRSTNYLDEAGKFARQISQELNQKDVKKIIRASEALDKVREQFLRFLQKDSSGNFVLTPDFFLNIMRQYNCKYDINGVEWGGPTAANCAPYMSLDFIIGTTDADYQKHVISRLRYMTEEDQIRLNEDIQQDSLLLSILRHLKLNKQELLEKDAKEISVLIENSKASAKRFIEAYLEVAQKFHLLSSLHYGLIKNYFLKTSNKESTTSDSEKDSVNNAIDNDKGTSGMSFQEVMRIRDMRKLNPLITKLDEVVKLK
jgi:Domain of unknown function (DUF1864)